MLPDQFRGLNFFRESIASYPSAASPSVTLTSSCGSIGSGGDVVKCNVGDMGMLAACEAAKQDGAPAGLAGLQQYCDSRPAARLTQRGAVESPACPAVAA